MISSSKLTFFSFFSLNFFSQRIGEAEEEGKGGQIRATLLSNRATTLLKVSFHQFDGDHYYTNAFSS